MGRQEVIAFHKQELLDAYENGAPQSHIDSHRFRLVLHLGLQQIEALKPLAKVIPFKPKEEPGDLVA